MAGDLDLKNIWNAPGYRDLRLVAVDRQTGREYSVRVAAKDMQRLISACADAVQQIGVEGPIDWDQHPTQIYWPNVTPWKSGPRKASPKSVEAA